MKKNIEKSKNYRQRVFSKGVYNVEVKLNHNRDGFENLFGWYNDESKYISIMTDNIKEGYEDSDFSEDYIVEQIEQTIIHELTHFFDYNCFLSFSYKEDNPAEHLATFMQLFGQVIINLKNDIIKWIIEEGESF